MIITIIITILDKIIAILETVVLEGNLVTILTEEEVVDRVEEEEVEGVMMIILNNNNHKTKDSEPASIKK